MNIGANWADALSHEARSVEAPAPQGNWAAEHVEEMKWINTSKFDFALKMRLVYMRWGALTVGQLAAVQRCMSAERNRTLSTRLPVEPPSHADMHVLDLTKIPSGLYSVPHGQTRLKVCIKRGTGKWQGWIFVSDGAEYGQGTRYGSQRPGETYKGQIFDQLLAISRDAVAASAAYGRLTGTCGVCGRKLEDKDSVARGIGPICAERLGWE